MRWWKTYRARRGGSDPAAGLRALGACLAGERAQEGVAHWQAVAVAACEQSGHARAARSRRCAACQTNGWPRCRRRAMNNARCSACAMRMLCLQPGAMRARRALAQRPQAARPKPKTRRAVRDSRRCRLGPARRRGYRTTRAAGLDSAQRQVMIAGRAHHGRFHFIIPHGGGRESSRFGGSAHSARAAGRRWQARPRCCAAVIGMLAIEPGQRRRRRLADLVTRFSRAASAT